MTYTTIQGDTWDMIAYKLFQKESLMVQIMNANYDYVDTAVFGAGVVLNIPTIFTETAADLPPWKVNS